MYKTAVIAFLACVIIGVYLYAANAYFYHRIHIGYLVFPDTTHSYTIQGPGAAKPYAALGDSLTAGVGATKYNDSFPYRVAEKMSAESAITLKVFAYPGLTSAGLVTSYLPPAVETQPDIVTILIGINDIHNWVSAREFEKNYRTILASFPADTTRISAISIPYLGSNTALFPPLNFYFAWKTRHFNAIIKRLAAEYGATYIDIAEPTHELFKTDGVQYAADSFHPSAIGYQQWVDIIYANIRQ